MIQQWHETAERWLCISFHILKRIRTQENEQKNISFAWYHRSSLSGGFSFGRRIKFFSLSNAADGKAQILLVGKLFQSTLSILSVQTARDSCAMFNSGPKALFCGGARERERKKTLKWLELQLWVINRKQKGNFHSKALHKKLTSERWFKAEWWRNPSI